MTEFKFSCSKCGQHMSATENWAGRQLQCPACQSSITVPSLPAAPKPVAPPPLPPIITSNPPVPPPLRTTLAASATAPVSKKGWGWAKTGLALGCTLAFVGLLALAVNSFVGSRRVVTNRAPTGPRPIRSKPPTVGQPVPTPSPPSIARDTQRPQRFSRSYNPPRFSGPPVSIDPKTVEIPSTPLEGMLCGRPFRATSANLWGKLLTIEQGQSPASMAEIKIFLDSQDAASLANQTYTLTPTQESPGIKSIHYLQRSGGNTSGIAKDHAARLEFGALSGKQLPAKLYLELPQGDQTRILGAFTIELK